MSQWNTKLVEYHEEDWNAFVESGWFTCRVDVINGMRVATMRRLGT